MKDKPSKKECRIAILAGWCWLVVLVLLLFCSCEVQGAQGAGASHRQAAVCRITNQLQGAANVGSGTLIDKTEDGREGLVLTCAHLFREGVGEIVVRFADGRAHRAKLIDYSQQADLAALAIANPTGQPANIAFEVHAQKKLHACGYGPQGIYRCAVGSVVGRAESPGQVSLRIDDAVRSGDSGGGVFDEQGRLVAVIWGEAQGVTYASYGRPLRSFLGRVLGRRTSVVYACPNGRCPVQPPTVARRPAVPASPQRENVMGFESQLQGLQKQIEELRLAKQDRGDYLTRGELPDLGSFASRTEVQQLETDSASRHKSILERIESLSGGSVGKATGKAAAGLLGLSGPAGLAVVAASTFGGWLLGRGIKRRLKQPGRGGAGGRRRRRFQRSG